MSKLFFLFELNSAFLDQEMKDMSWKSFPLTEFYNVALYFYFWYWTLFIWEITTSPIIWTLIPIAFSWNILFSSFFPAFTCPRVLLFVLGLKFSFSLTWKYRDSFQLIPKITKKNNPKQQTILSRFMKQITESFICLHKSIEHFVESAYKKSINISLDIHADIRILSYHSDSVKSKTFK